MEQFVQYALSGVTTGSIYAVIALGFTIIYNATGIVNFAQGEFLILGALLAISLDKLLPLAAAILAAVIITAMYGAVLELAFVRWLKEPGVLRLIIITIALSILSREGFLHVWDEKVVALSYFSGNELTTISVLGARISPQVLWVLGIGALSVLGLSLFFRFTVTGKAMRACADNRTSARLCGINTRTLITLSFALSAALGALAGCAISPIAQTQYDMGAALAIKGFSAAVLGGLGNGAAAVVSALFLGLLEALSISLLPLAYKDVAALLVLLAILSFKPTGLFGRLAR